MSQEKEPLCECCESEPGIGVASLLGIPISIMWGRKCLEADIIPYWTAVANTACLDGLDHSNEEWKDLVNRTLRYFNKTLEQFNIDVTKDIEEMRGNL